MKKWIGIAAVSMLAGCASAPEKPVVKTGADALLTNKPLPKAPAKRQAAIDENVLYLLMAAEMAGQRNQYQLALDAYLQAGKWVSDSRVAERAVKIALFLKDEKRTKEAVALWLSKEPNNMTAHKFAALAAMRNKNKDEAVEQLNAAWQIDPAGFESVLLEMVGMLDKDVEPEFVNQVIEGLSQRHPQEASLLFVQAVWASSQHKLDIAQQKLDQALVLQPDWDKAILLQAQLAVRTGDREKARRYLEKALKQAPDDSRLRKMLLEVLVDAGAYDDAIALYQDVLEKKPNDGESLFAIALIYMQQNKLDKARDYLERVSDDYEWEAQAHFYLGKLDYEQKRYDRALAHFDKVQEGSYAFEAATTAVAMLLSQQRYSEAEERIGLLLTKYPDQRLRVWLLQAELHNGQKRYQQAFDVLAAALQQAADNRDVLYTQALVAERLDKLEVVEANLKKILGKKPDDVAVLNALGYTLVDRTTRYAEAEKYLLHALKLQPDEAVIVDSYGWLLFKQGKQEEALGYLRRAYDKQPENEIAAHIVEVLWSQGRQDEAKSFFHKVFKKAPDDEYLLKFKQRFLSSEE